MAEGYLDPGPISDTSDPCRVCLGPVNPITIWVYGIGFRVMDFGLRPYKPYLGLGRPKTLNPKPCLDSGRPGTLNPKPKALFRFRATRNRDDAPPSERKATAGPLPESDGERGWKTGTSLPKNP